MCRAGARHRRAVAGRRDLSRRVRRQSGRRRVLSQVRLRGSRTRHVPRHAAHLLSAAVVMAREKGVRPLFVAGIAAAGAALLVVQWAAARPLWLDEELLAINVRDRAIPNYLEALWLGQTALFRWLVLGRLLGPTPRPREPPPAPLP